jgi:putative tryptophan/tyrosine transport system substrate-binding protein
LQNRVFSRRDALSALVLLCASPHTFGQSARKATVAVLIPFPESDAESRRRRDAFASALQALGWREPQNLRLEVRYGMGDAALRRHAADLAALKPDLMVVQSNQAFAIVRQENVAIPIVFLAVSDPVGSGFVANLARPGGNSTGFTNFAPEMGAKWLEVLKELAPRVERVGLLLNPSIAANVELARAAEAAAAPLAIGVTPIVSGDGALEQALAQLARGNGRAGVIVLPNPTNTNSQKQIIEAVARHGLPAIYPFPYYAKNGGLAAYGIDIMEMFRLAAPYVDRILKGARPAELPVQQPTKYELVINLRAARALSLDVPAALRARADELIE